MVKVLKHGLIGFVAAFLVTVFVLQYFGVLPLSNDLNQLEIDRKIQSLWLTFYIACAGAIFAAVLGSATIPKFWRTLAIVFGVICVIPFWPMPDGSLVPLGTPYVNRRFGAEGEILLAIHVSLSLVVAAFIHWVEVICGRNPAKKED